MQPWQFLPVHSALKQVVDTMIVMKVDDFSSLPVSSQFYYPWSAQTNLFFTISEQIVTVMDNGKSAFTTYPANFIIGPNLVERIVQCPNQHYVLGITFKAGGLQRLCGLPLDEIINLSVDASFILGKDINRLAEQLAEAKNQQELLILVNIFLLGKLKNLQPLTPFDRAISELVCADGNLSMDEVSRLACISGRQFERRSLERLGMSPKLFARLIRFSKAYKLKESNPYLNWTNIAYLCGYYDQMHLIRDFKSFSGYTPTAIQHKIENSITAVTALQSASV